MKYQGFGLAIFASLVVTVLSAEMALAETADGLRQSVLDALMAEQIAIDCPTLKQDRKPNRTLDKRLWAARKEQNLSEKRLYSEYLQLSERDVVTHGKAFLKAQNIEVDNVASWCRTGERLITEGDPVGKYLLKR